METGRWTEVLRRGEDATGTALPEDQHQSFVPDQDPDPMTAGFGDGRDGEFYIGKSPPELSDTPCPSLGYRTVF